MNIICVKCEVQAPDLDRICCDQCSKCFHSICAGLSRQEALCVRAKDRKISFYCDKCKSLINSITNLNIIVGELRDQIDKLNKDFGDLKIKYEAQKTVGDNDAEKTQTASDINNITQLMEEVNEREIRSKNVLIFNLPESSKPTKDERREDDALRSSNIITTCSNVNLNILQVHRLGRYNASIKRPIKIILESRADVIKILQNKSKINIGNVKIGPDQTKMQQNHFKDLVKQINELRTKGVTNKIIKYINGIPRIVTKN